MKTMAGPPVDDAKDIDQALASLAHLFGDKKHCHYREPAPCVGGYPLCNYRGTDCVYQIRPPAKAQYCRWQVDAEKILGILPERLKATVTLQKKADIGMPAFD